MGEGQLAQVKHLEEFPRGGKPPLEVWVGVWEGGGWKE